MYLCIYIYIYDCICICIYTRAPAYTYAFTIYTSREEATFRERELMVKQTGGQALVQVQQERQKLQLEMSK